MRRMMLLGSTLFAFSLGTGCGKSKPPSLPPVAVTGKVVLASGKPVANMVISFHPQDGPNAVSRPSAALDKNGAYAMNVVPGRYKVTLAPIPAHAGSAGAADLAVPKKGDVKEAQDILSGYKDALSSRLEVTVPETGGELSPLTVR